MSNSSLGERFLEIRAGVYRIQDAIRRRRPQYLRISQFRSQFYNEMWRDAADQIGATVEALGGDILDIRLGQNRTRVCFHMTALDDPVTIVLAHNKVLTYQLLAQRNLSIPAYCEFNLNEIDKAAAFLQRMGGACVVKPAVGSGGYGVTTGITNRSQLIRGIVAAAAYSRRFVIEQQIKGDVYRLLYLDGQLLDAVLRGRPKVTGDGRSSVRQLVEAHNQSGATTGFSMAHDELTIDGDMRHTLLQQGLSLSSVPREGKVVTLKTVINQNSKAENVTATKLLCPSMIDEGAAAAQALGIRLAGIEVITTDPGVPLSKSGGVIIDVNPSPALHYHYHKRDGGCSVARSILPCLLSQQPDAQRVRAVVA
jgi:glutathione synthase/RimK-type ligase-like ATP-grasp enzyme